MQDNDERGFWDEDRDWMTHGDAGRRCRVRPALRARGIVAPAMGRTDPRRRRITAMGAAVLAAIAVAFVVRGTGSDAQILAAGAAGAASVAVDTMATPSTQPPPTAPVSTAAGSSESSATESSATESSATASSTTASSSTDAAVVQIESAPVARPQDVTLVIDKKRTCAIAYTVRAGDYWIGLAKASKVTVAALLSANGATASTPMYPGDAICLPANAAVPTPSTAAKVTPTPTTAKPTPTTAKATPATVQAKPTTAKAPTTTAAPPTTAAPATTAPPPARTYTRAEIEQIIRNVWPDDLEEKAIQIATRESNLVPTAHNSCCTGLFQIYFNANRSSLMSWGITSATMLYDPQVNALAAYAMYLRSGWGPWGG